MDEQLSKMLSQYAHIEPISIAARSDATALLARGVSLLFKTSKYRCGVVRVLVHRKLFLNRWSDLTIIVGSDALSFLPTFATTTTSSSSSSTSSSTTASAYQVHRFVLAARSPYFAALFSSGMRDAHDSKLRFDDIDADAMLAFLHYVYNDVVSDELIETCAVQTLILACRFQVPRLAQLLSTVIGENLTPDVAPAIHLLACNNNLKMLSEKTAVRRTGGGGVVVALTLFVLCSYIWH
jgi:hypothetical protein